MGDVRAAVEGFEALASYAREQGRADEEAGRCWNSAARSPGSIETGAWRPGSRRSRSPPACPTRRCRRMSAGTAAAAHPVRRLAGRGRGGVSPRHRRRAARRGEAAAEPARRPLRASAEPPGGLPGGCSYRGGGPAVGAGGGRRVSLHDVPVPPRVGAAAPRRMGGAARCPPRRTRDGGAKRASPLGAGVPVPDGVVADARREFRERSGALRARAAAGCGGPGGPASGLDRPRIRPARLEEIRGGAARVPGGHRAVHADALDSPDAAAAGARPVLARAQAVRPRARTAAGAVSARGDVGRADVPGARPPGARRGRARPARLPAAERELSEALHAVARIRGSPGGVESLRDGGPY